ncbi:MAG: hypothetical protein ABIS92_13215 [Polyangia bacterium]
MTIQTLRGLVGTLVLVVVGAAGCATAPSGVVARGTVVSRAAATRLIVSGPATVHAYAGFTGGEIHSAPAVTGTDADCAHITNGGSGAVTVPRDRVISVTVAAGDVACLRTTADRGYELLWHALAQPPVSQLVAELPERRAF